MASVGQGLDELAEEVMSALIKHGPPDSRAEIEDELAVLRNLNLGSEDFSAEGFIQAEVRRALGV